MLEYLYVLDNSLFCICDKQHPGTNNHFRIILRQSRDTNEQRK